MSKKPIFRHLAISCLVALILVATGPQSASAQSPASSTVGTLQVECYGNRGRAVILIPGLESGTWVWRQTIANLQKGHVVYAVTLAGFDGVSEPQDDGRLLDRAGDSLLRLIREHKIARPVLVGHSLGGTLAPRFASEHAELVSEVVAVDGPPAFPGMERVDDGKRQAMAAPVRQRMPAAAPEQFVARYMAGDLAADLRPGLKHVNVPILEISPYNAPDFSQPSMAMSEAQGTAYDESLRANAPDATVVSISPARHFVMLDQPA